MRIKAWVRGFFGFSRRETNAFLILLPLMVLVLFSEPAYRHWQSQYPPDHSKDQKAMDSLLATLAFVTTDSITEKKSVQAHRSVSFHSFDPNTLPEEQLINLGLSSFLSNRIVRYREKGGRFRKKEDLLKIYGMDSSWFEKAKPWIAIVDASPPIATTRTPLNKEKEKKPIAYLPLDINLADTIQLMKVYGIGPALSKRICLFRDKLGGFISMDQLKEVYGLDTLVVKELNKKFFVAEDFIPQKIKLNTMTLEVKHPYIRRKEAQAIVAYRLQHGNIQNIDQLLEIKVLTKEWIEKVRKYITVDHINNSTNQPIPK
jgi:competence protein ComEA